MKIAVDAMGGDFAPKEIVAGAILAAKRYDCEIVLVGDQTQIQKELDKNYPEWRKSTISIHHASDVVGMGEHPGVAVRRKKDSSIVVATRLVKEGECDAVLSAGNTGAAAASALFILGRIKGIDRPSIATPIPTGKGSVTLLLDSGANVDCKPKHLCQSALMGSIYAKCMLGLENPAVGLLNIGEEATKGNEQAQATYPMLKSMKTINFKGNAEGLAKTLVSLAKDAINKGGILAKLGALMLMPALKKLGKDIDVSEYGGAPLLGVNGCCIISHGSSNAKAICSAIRQASEFVQKDVITQIRDNIDKEEIWSHDTEVK